MKILLATDGSSCSDTAVGEVARRPWPPGTEVRVISVVEPHAPLTPEPLGNLAGYFDAMMSIEQNQARDAVEQAAAKLRQREDGSPLKVTTEVLPGSAKRVIVEEAKAWGADLIVVGSHGYKSWERMLLGSVSQAVAVHAECSVEIVRQHK